jgi:hypothetical protein
VIEVQGIDSELLRAQEGVSWRHLRWHTPENVALAVRSVLASDDPLCEKLAGLRLHAAHFCYRFANVGTGMLAAWGFLGLEPPLPAGASMDGFLPLESERAEVFRVRRREFLADLDALAARNAHLAGDTPEPDERVLIGALRELARDVRAAGVEPVLLLQPSIDRRHDGVRAAFADGTEARLLVYNDPALFPELFTPEARFDLDHLSSRGAAVLTRRLADDLARESGPPGR